MRIYLNNEEVERNEVPYIRESINKHLNAIACISLLDEIIALCDENKHVVIKFGDDDDYNEIVRLMFIWKDINPKQMKKANAFARKLYNPKNWER